MWLTFQYLDPIASVSLAAYPSSRTSSTPPRYGSKDVATTASSSASTTSTRKARPHTGRPAACPSGRTRRTSLGAAYPRQGQAQEVTGRPALKRARLRTPGKSQAPIRGWPLSRKPSHGATGPAKPAAPNGKALQKKLSRHNVFPVREALFSFQPVTPHRIGPRRVLHLPSRIPNKTPAARKRQALSSPEGGGHSPAAFAEGECLREGRCGIPVGDRTPRFGARRARSSG